MILQSEFWVLLLRRFGRNFLDMFFIFTDHLWIRHFNFKYRISEDKVLWDIPYLNSINLLLFIFSIFDAKINLLIHVPKFIGLIRGGNI